MLTGYGDVATLDKDGNPVLVSKTFVLRKDDDYLKYVQTYRGGGVEIGERTLDNRWHFHVGFNSSDVPKLIAILTSEDAFDFPPLETQEDEEETSDK